MSVFQSKTGKRKLVLIRFHGLEISNMNRLGARRCSLAAPLPCLNTDVDDTSSSIFAEDMTDFLFSTHKFHSFSAQFRKVPYA